MKLALSSFLFLFILLIREDKSYSLTDFKIKKICKKEIRKSICIKTLEKRRYNLKKGNLIEIPVIPHKR
tara:strand:- start:198 stop:404 length:207 start_codon:yes stop_codon:yes gene_type:complete